MKLKDVLKASWYAALSIGSVATDVISILLQLADFTPSVFVKILAVVSASVDFQVYKLNIKEGFGQCNLLINKFFNQNLIIQVLEKELEDIKEFEKSFKQRVETFYSDLQNGKIFEGITPEQKAKLNNIEFFENNDLKRDKLDEFLSLVDEIERSNLIAYKFISFQNVKNLYSLREDYNKFKEKIKEINCHFLLSYLSNKEVSGDEHSAGESKEKSRKNLNILQKLFINFVLSSENENKPCAYDIPDDFLKRIKEKYAEGKPKLIQLRLAMLFSICIGIASALLIFYTSPAVLSLVGISFIAFPVGFLFILGPLVIIGAICSTIITYNTLTDLILHENLSTWWKKINQKIKEKHSDPQGIKYISLIIYKTISQSFINLITWFKPKQHEHWFIYVLRVILSVLMVGFAVMATLATGYTAFIQLSDYVNITVCILTALPLMTGNLIFTLKNSFESISLLTEISLTHVINSIKAWFNNLKKQIRQENYLQILLHLIRLPLLLSLKIFKGCMLLVHVVLGAIAADRFFQVPGWMVVCFSAVSELITDIFPLFGEKNEEGHAHGGGIIKWIATAIIILPVTGLGILNYFFSQFNRYDSNPERVALGFREAIKKELYQFDILHLHEEKDDKQKISTDQKASILLSPAIINAAIISICEEQRLRLQTCCKKLEVFDSLKRGTTVSEENKAVVAEHRGIFQGFPTKSQQALNEILALQDQSPWYRGAPQPILLVPNHQPS